MEQLARETRQEIELLLKASGVSAEVSAKQTKEMVEAVGKEFVLQLLAAANPEQKEKLEKVETVEDLVKVLPLWKGEEVAKHWLVASQKVIGKYVQALKVLMEETEWKKLTERYDKLIEKV